MPNNPIVDVTVQSPPGSNQIMSNGMKWFLNLFLDLDLMIYLILNY